VKKLILFALACLMLLVPAASLAETKDLALVTDLGTINDKSFNQGAWEGLEKYALEAGISYDYLQPKEQSDDAYLDAIQQVVENGAKLVVTPGFLFEPAVFIAQDMYPEVHFVLLDGEPHTADYSEYRTEANAVAILYAEEQAGFLAGYAAVKDGYTKLGFLGGMAVPAVIRFGYGYVQGAEYAAAELGITDVSVVYNYTGGFAATPEAQALASSWYNDGVEVIFGCGGAVGNSAMAAAEAAGGKYVIGVDKDQSAESETVITSATKDLSQSVYDAIAGMYNGAFTGGQTLVYSASQKGVGLPMETSKFKTFSQEDYDAIFAKLAADEIVIVKDVKDGAPVTIADLPLSIVKVTEVQ
jgi:basic membrane protein A